MNNKNKQRREELIKQRDEYKKAILKDSEVIKDELLENSKRIVLVAGSAYLTYRIVKWTLKPSRKNTKTKAKQSQITTTHPTTPKDEKEGFISGFLKKEMSAIVSNLLKDLGKQALEAFLEKQKKREQNTRRG